MEFYEDIIESEKYIPMAYLDYKLTPWGRMISDISNKESFSSNYAVIYKSGNFNEIIKEIEEYYNSKDITPKVFYRHGSIELNVVRPYFERYNYLIREFDIELMMLKRSGNRTNKIKECMINIIFGHVLDGKEYNLVIEQDEGETYGVKLLNRQISVVNNMFFAYDELNNPVSMALAEKYNNVVYISNVYTTPLMRCQGYGMAVINAIISYYKNEIIYLHTHNPEAASIYNQLGFSGERFNSWWAVKGSLPEWCKQ